MKGSFSGSPDLEVISQPDQSSIHCPIRLSIQSFDEAISNPHFFTKSPGEPFFGVQASGGDSAIRDYIFPDEPEGPLLYRFEGSANWSISGTSASWSRQLVRRRVNYQSYIEDGSIITESYEREYLYISPNAEVSYTLVNTEPSPVPEPLTSGGTALALAGLSWLKHKKKMAA